MTTAQGLTRRLSLIYNIARFLAVIAHVPLGLGRGVPFIISAINESIWPILWTGGLAGMRE